VRTGKGVPRDAPRLIYRGMRDSNFFISKAQHFIDLLKDDSRMGHYNLTIDSDKLPAIISWNNPEDDVDWRNSGWADGYNGDFSNVPPLRVLAVIGDYILPDARIARISSETLLEVMIKRGIYPYCLYKLSDEEKYYGKIYTMGEFAEYDLQNLVAVNSLEDFKRAIKESIYNTD